MIAGDIDLDETRRLVDYWFGEIPRGPDSGRPQPRPAGLQASRSLVWEDNFATLPELRIAFPTVEQFNADQYALDALAELLAGSRVAPLYQTVVEEGRLAPDVSVTHQTGELAGAVRANVTLESMELLQDELRNYAAQDVELTKNQVIKGSTRAFESLPAKLTLLREMSRLDLPADFLERQQDELLAMTRDDFRALIDTYLDERQMVYVAVGDAATQLEGLTALGYGEPIRLTIYGEPAE